MGTTILTKSPHAAAVLFGLGQKGSLSQELKEKGYDLEDRANLSTIGGVFEGGLEYIGLEALFTKFAKNKVMDGIFHSMTEAIQEASQQIAENVTMQLSGARKNEKITDFFDGVGMSALIGGILGGGARTALNIAEENKVIKNLEDMGIEKEKAKKIAFPLLQEIRNKVVQAAKPLVQIEANESNNAMPVPQTPIQMDAEALF